MKCSKFVAKIEDFEEAYRDMLTRKTQFVAEFWTFRQASGVLGPIMRLDYQQALTQSGCSDSYRSGGCIFPPALFSTCGGSILWRKRREGRWGGRCLYKKRGPQSETMKFPRQVF